MVIDLEAVDKRLGKNNPWANTSFDGVWLFNTCIKLIGEIQTNRKEIERLNEDISKNEIDVALQDLKRISEERKKRI